MDDTAQRNFCSNCGAHIAGGTRFCSACGTPLDPSAPIGYAPTAQPGPAPASPQAAAPASGQRAAGRTRLTRYWRVAIPVWLALVLLAFAVSFAYGWVSQPAGLHLPTPDQAEALESLGMPAGWVVTDGPGTPGQDDMVRVEEWLYPFEGLTLTFVDGVETQRVQLTFTEDRVNTSVSPVELDRTMSRSDVEKLLGEQGQRVEADDAGYPDYEAYLYPASRLAVGYSRGRMLTAQTY